MLVAKPGDSKLANGGGRERAKGLKRGGGRRTGVRERERSEAKFSGRIVDRKSVEAFGETTTRLIFRKCIDSYFLFSWICSARRLSLCELYNVDKCKTVTKTPFCPSISIKCLSPSDLLQYKPHRDTM